MAITRTRKSIDEKISELEAQLKAAKEAKKAQAKKKGNELTKDSAGILEAITAIETAAKENKCTLADVIKTISKIKRTGLTIENGVRKPKA